MKATLLCLAALFALSISAHYAHALTIDNDRGMNSDGSAKFSDPDEKRPGYLNGGADPESSDHPSSSTRSPSNISPGIMGSDSRGPFNPYNNGNDAFDRAYSHK